MTYVLFVYDRPDSLAALDEDAQRAVFAEYEALQTVPGLEGRRLASASEAVTVRVESGETPERADDDLALVGFYVVATDDREHALEIAGRIPAARLGGAVDVRAVMERS